MAAAAGGETILLSPGTYPVVYTNGAKNTLNFTRSGSS